MLNNGCEAGCQAYTGGEIRHHRDCQFYPESFSKMYDDLKKESERLKTKKCNWKQDEIQNTYKTDCGIEYEEHEYLDNAQEFDYCPYCGLKINVL